MNHRAWIFSLGLMLSAAPLLPAHAQLFGESDEEKAARQQHEDGQDSKINDQAEQLKALQDRIKSLEDNVQSLTQSLSQSTGANEELSHQLALMNDKLDRQQKDFAYRLCMLSAQQLGAGGDNQGLNCAAAGTATPAPGAPPARMAPGTALAPLGGDNGGALPALSSSGVSASGPGRPPGTLGTLPSGPAPGPQQAVGSNGPSQFDTAMNLLGKAQYAEASAAFRAYADANPDDEDLSSQSIFWIGNIAYVQQDYPNAARAFAEELKKYPKAARSPDAMLKLGQSLLAQGQTSGGCTTLGLLKTKYPKASTSTLAAAAGARKASCGK
jgi:tol-pal system protein YbgF